MRQRIEKGSTDEIQLQYVGEFLNFMKQCYMANEMEVRLVFSPDKGNDWVVVEYLQDLHLQPRSDKTDLKKVKW